MILVWLLEANYTLNIFFFFLLVANYSRNIPFFRLQTHTLCSLNIPHNSLYNASYYMCRKITSHWQPLFSKKMVAAASFSYKIGGGGLIFQQNWRQGFGNITGGCSDMVWILDSHMQVATIIHRNCSGYRLFRLFRILEQCI